MTTTYSLFCFPTETGIYPPIEILQGIFCKYHPPQIVLGFNIGGAIINY